jgi:beta-N-acetylhexosaminidase
MADEEGGGIQRLAGAVPSFPWARQVAATVTVEQTRQMGQSTGSSMRRIGVTVNLAPVLDVDGGDGPNSTDADGQRSYSPDPAVAARYGLAFAAGLRAAGVLPVVKHFPGLGGTVGNTDVGPGATPPLTTLRRAGLLPFQSAIAAGTPAVMVANASVPGLSTLPASLSSAAITGLLRGELGFSGLVVTDSLSAGAVSAAGYDVPHAAVAAIEAGSDLILFGSTLTEAQTALLSPANVARSMQAIQDALVSAVQSGALPVKRLNDAVGHVLAAAGTNLCG